MNLNKTVLDNGLTVITDSIDTVRTVATGVWFTVGSRDETPERAGMAHFMEHMAFKGTPTRDTFQISEEFDRLGASQNAFTSREVTCYHAKCIDESAEGVFDIVADMVLNPRLDQSDCVLEREVIIEELHRSEDDPEDVGAELFLKNLWPSNELGLPIGGSPEVVGTFDHDAVTNFHQEFYRASNCFVTAAGNLDHDSFVEMVASKLGTIAPAQDRDRRPVPAAVVESRIIKHRDTEQAHLYVGTATMKAEDPRRPALNLVSTILGGSSSSRLFKEVREKLGLVYAIYSFPQLFTDAGMFGIYAGTRPDNAEQVHELVMKELARLAAGDLSIEDLELARSATRGHMAMGLESTTSRMRRLGENHYLRGTMLTYDEAVARLEAVTLDDIRGVAAEIGSSPMVTAAVGPIGEDLRPVAAAE